MGNHPLRAALIGAAWLYACGAGDDRPGLYVSTSARASASAARWCDSMCDSFNRCQGSVAPGCSDNCLRTDPGYFARISEASLAEQIRCLEQAVCPSEFDQLLDQCWRESLQGLEPSDESAEQCEALAPEFFQCNWFSSRLSCERFHANFSAPALAAERQCAGSSCGDLDDCIATRLFEYGED